MMMKTVSGASFVKAAALLPLLALTACAGSQRFVGGGSAAPVYSQPALEPLPPVSSAPVTSQPLPPPGGYPVASAPAPSTGALPPPQDPYSTPTTGAAVSAPTTLPVQTPTNQDIPTLRGGGGQIATLGTAPTARGAASSRDSVIGSWTAREATGGSCRVSLSSSPALDLYRANANGCTNKDLQKVNAWDYRNGEVYLYQQGGTVVARLRANDAGSMSGAVTKSGASLSLSR